MSQPSNIEIRGLRKSFGSNEVLKNINLDVAKGGVVAKYEEGGAADAAALPPESETGYRTFCGT